MKECNVKSRAAQMEPGTKDRATFANKVFCSLCEKHGIRVCSWDRSPALKEYVEGKINEKELSRFANTSTRDYVRIRFDFRSSMDPVLDSKDAQKLRRTKIANKIYRHVCSNSGQSACFFKDFDVWSEFVEGRMDEDAFLESAILEVLKMKDTIH